MKRGGISKSSATSKLSKKKNAENRQAKLRGASSARSVEALASDGVPVSAGRGGLASYRIGNTAHLDPNKGAFCEDPEFTRCMRLLNKRDTITREKALSSLKEFFESRNVDDLKPLIPIWAKRYCRIFMDNSRSVRVALLEAFLSFVKKMGKFIYPALTIIAGPWLCSLHDPVASVVSVAVLSFDSAFPDRNKQKNALNYLLPHFLEYAESMLSATPKTISMSWDTKDESEERYERIICSCINGITSYDYNLIASVTPSVLKTLKSKHSLIRRAVYEFISHHCSSWDSAGPALSIMSDQDFSTRRYMWSAVVAISKKFPEEWTTHYSNRLIELLQSPSVDLFAYGACLPILESRHSFKGFCLSVDFHKQLNDALWIGFKTFSKGPSMANPAALISSFTSCFEFSFENFADDHVQSDFLRYCIWDRIVSSFQSLQATKLDSSDGFRFQEAGILSTTFSILGRLLTTKYDVPWVEPSLSEFCCDSLSSDCLLMTELGHLLLAAERPSVNTAVFVKALSLNLASTTLLCLSLIFHFPLSHDVIQLIRQAFQQALLCDEVPPRLVELYCNAVKDHEIEVLDAVLTSNNIQLLFDFIELCQSSDPQLWQKVCSACLLLFISQLSTGCSRPEPFSACFKKLLSQFPDECAQCRDYFIERVLALSKTIEDHSVVHDIAQDFAAFETKCTCTHVALSALTEAQFRSRDFSTALFFIGCLRIFTPETSNFQVLDCDFMQELADLARSSLSTITTDKPSVYRNVCSKLKKQLVSCDPASFDFILWASFASHVPTEIIMDCLPNSASFLAVSDPNSGQLICDACMEVMDIVSEFSYPGAFNMSLWMLESRFCLDQRSGRLVLSRASSNGYSLSEITEMLDVGLEAIEAFDTVHIHESVKQFSLSIAQAYPESIMERFVTTSSMLSKMDLIPALAIVKDEFVVSMLEQCFLEWSENCAQGKDVTYSAMCIAAALSSGFQFSMESVWNVVHSIPQSDLFSRSKFHLMGAAIETFPINETATEIVDAVAWIKDVLEEQDPSTIESALQLLKSITNRCGSNPFHIQEAIDMCLPLLSPASLRQLRSNPRSFIWLRDLTYHIDFKTIPRESCNVLIKNLLHEMTSPSSEMSALAYSLTSRVLIAGAVSVDIGDSDPHGDDLVFKAQQLIPSCVLDLILFDPLSVNAAPPLLRRYLLVWLAFIDAISAISADRRDILTSYLRYFASEGVSLFFQELMENILASPPVAPQLILESNASQNLTKFPPYFRRLKSSPHSCRLFGGLASHVYYQALLTVPVLSRLWYSSCERSAADVYKKLTTKRFTTLLIDHEIAALQQAGVDDTFSVKCTKSGEIFAVLRYSEVTVRLQIRLAPEHPLRSADIDLSGTKGVDAKRIKWWSLNINMMMSSKNGSVQDAVLLWKRNVESHFDDVEECPICYSILHAVTEQLPRMVCRVCKNKFHSACMYKWFSSSSGSSCPLCRSAF